MPAGYVMRVVAIAGDAGSFDPTGKYIMSIPDIDSPCTWAFTAHASKAKRFKDTEKAMELRNMQSIQRPLRPDGKPNRPLTTFSMMIQAIASVP
jgi:hypothetical protein